jgi:periplasmic copper chaperone A
MKRDRVRQTFSVLAFAAFTLVACLASAETAGSITVENAWSRASPDGIKVAAGYLTIINNGDQPDRLLSASAPFAAATEIHKTSMADGVMRMRPVPDGVPLPAKSTVMLQPNSYHLMFMGLTEPLKDGDTVTANLTFERAGTVSITIDVLAVGAQGPKTEPTQ